MIRPLRSTDPTLEDPMHLVLRILHRWPARLLGVRGFETLRLAAPLLNHRGQVCATAYGSGVLLGVRGFETLRLAAPLLNHRGRACISAYGFDKLNRRTGRVSFSAHQSGLD